MFGFSQVVHCFLSSCWRKRREEVRALYPQPGRLEDGTAVFSCGCQYPFIDPEEKAVICASHRAIFAAEVAA